MTILHADWVKLTEEQQKKTARPRVTNEQRSEAIRAQQALDHPGYTLLQAKLCEHKDRLTIKMDDAKMNLAHRRGLTTDQIHAIRCDIAECYGWLAAINVALDILPSAVTVARES